MFEVVAVCPAADVLSREGDLIQKHIEAGCALLNLMGVVWVPKRQVLRAQPIRLRGPRYFTSTVSLAEMECGHRQFGAAPGPKHNPSARCYQCAGLDIGEQGPPGIGAA